MEALQMGWATRHSKILWCPMTFERGLRVAGIFLFPGSMPLRRLAAGELEMARTAGDLPYLELRFGERLLWRVRSPNPEC